VKYFSLFLYPRNNKNVVSIFYFKNISKEKITRIALMKQKFLVLCGIFEDFWWKCLRTPQQKQLTPKRWIF